MPSHPAVRPLVRQIAISYRQLEEMIAECGFAVDHNHLTVDPVARWWTVSKTLLIETQP
jgi:transposase-like protein